MKTIDQRFIEINDEYKSLNIGQSLDYDKFNAYAITAHSTAIEGATLSVFDTSLLLENKLPITGKTMEEMDMVRDHYQALIFVKKQAFNKVDLSIGMIQQANQKILKNTGKTINTVLGNFNTSDGELRRYAVLSTSGGYYMNHEKVPGALKQIVDGTNDLIKKALAPLDVHHLAFDFHYNLVTIHPFGDGNGRVSRLMMNYIQWYHSEPVTVIDANAKNEYISTLLKTRETSDLGFFRDFMKEAHIVYLKKEIDKYKEMLKSPGISKNKNNDFGMDIVFL